MIFDNVPEAPPDAVFGLLGAFSADSRPQKVNLLVGIYKNEQLQNEMMPSVIEAKSQVLPDVSLADYLPMDGSRDFVEAVGSLVFGDGNVYGAQAIGGTGALRIGGEFLAQEVGKTIYIPEFSWPNHRSIFERAGFCVETYPYYERTRHEFDANGCLAFLEKLPKRSIVLFHAACHNPTGCDPQMKEWAQIARVVRERQLLPFFDFAYQGLGDGLEKDAAAIRLFLSEGLEFLVAYSCSKNFSMYCQRVGALFVVTRNGSLKTKIASQIKRIVRAEFSNPPAHGAMIVTHILKGNLRSQWESELEKMRKRLHQMRCEFVRRLMAKKTSTDFRSLLEHKGMFSFIDLEKQQVQQLREKFGIYMLDNGRINIAGLNHKNLDYVADHIIQVI
ncbi:MAG: aromatic amino acid aminotransferase [Parachlamydiales bacterium]|nr:aromatic amino acid aminotransferase [Parachlamydiales bacterium]